MNDTIEVRDLRQQDWVWTAKALLFHPDVDEKMYKVYNGLASYADNTTQQAFPSILTLSKKLHMGRSTVIRALQKLEAFLFISVERQLGEHNTYCLLSLPESTPPKKAKVGKPPDEKPFNCDEYFEQMIGDSRKQIKIIGYFFQAKKLRFSTKEQVHVAIKRHLVAAKELIAFDTKLIGATIRKLNYDWPKFTLDTVVKELTK